MINLIEKVNSLNGVTVELIGSWLWVSGDTKPHKDVLLQLGLSYSGKKKAWYYFENKGKKRRGFYDMQTIRAKHGSLVLKEEK